MAAPDIRPLRPVRYCPHCGNSIVVRASEGGLEWCLECTSALSAQALDAMADRFADKVAERLATRMDQPRLLLTRDQAAKQLQISVAEVDRLRRAGQIREKSIGRTVRITASSLQDYAEGRR